VAARTPANPPELSGYRYLGPIGAGGFADVFRYEQELPRRTVAVKVLLAEPGPAGIAAFTSEANLMARLSTHPYIVTVYDAGVAPDGRPYLVMEYCSRPTLAQRYRERPLTVDEALRTGVRLAAAVETAHRAGILHRDIKPGNVLTNDYGWPALTDFGIASATDAEPAGHGGGGGADTEGSGSFGLSVPWSPPEMFLDEPRHDERSDVFSLAATLHTVLAGRSPFEVPEGPNSAADLMARIERGQPTPIGRDDIPRSLVAVLARGMATRPEDRYASALEFGRALQRVELELGYPATTLEVAEATPAVAAGGGGDADETRVRAIPTISPTISPAPAPASPASPPTEPRTSAIPEPESRQKAATRRGRQGGRGLSGVLVGVGSVLVVGMVALVIVLTGGGPGREGARPTPTHTGGSAVDPGAILPAVDGAAERDGTTVVFTWANPAPGDDDVYYWARTEAPDARQAVRETTVTLTGVDLASRVCINVEVGRAGRTSPPLVICAN